MFQCWLDPDRTDCPVGDGSWPRCQTPQQLPAAPFREGHWPRLRARLRPGKRKARRRPQPFREFDTAQVRRADVRAPRLRWRAGGHRPNTKVAVQTQSSIHKRPALSPRRRADALRSAHGHKCPDTAWKAEKSSLAPKPYLATTSQRLVLVSFRDHHTAIHRLA